MTSVILDLGAGFSTMASIETYYPYMQSCVFPISRSICAMNRYEDRTTIIDLVSSPVAGARAKAPSYSMFLLIDIVFYEYYD